MRYLMRSWLLAGAVAIGFAAADAAAEPLVILTVSQDPNMPTLQLENGGDGIVTSFSLFSGGTDGFDEVIVDATSNGFSAVVEVPAGADNTQGDGISPLMLRLSFGPGAGLEVFASGEFVTLLVDVDTPGLDNGVLDFDWLSGAVATATVDIDGTVSTVSFTFPDGISDASFTDGALSAELVLAVPEPATLAMFSVGLLGLAALRNARRRARTAKPAPTC